jgi:hypothetical protein
VKKKIESKNLKPFVYLEPIVKLECKDEDEILPIENNPISDNFLDFTLNETEESRNSVKSEDVHNYDNDDNYNNEEEEEDESIYFEQPPAKRLRSNPAALTYKKPQNKPKERTDDDPELHYCLFGCGALVKNMQLHISMIHKQLGREYICDFCNFKQKDKNKLRKHMRRHVSYQQKIANRIQCKFCSKKLSNSESLRSHIKIIHTDEIGDFPCTEPGCDRVYKYRMSLSYHVASAHVKT